MPRTKNIRFMDNQLATTNNSFASSEAVGFPFSSAIESQRSNVFRFGGNFDITDENNVIYANDGADFSVVIPVGFYTYSSLATQIQTSMNLVSSNWTCVYDLTTNKFAINRTIGTKILRLSQATDAIWDTIGYVGAVDEIPPEEADVARIHTKEFIQVDLGTSANKVGFVGFIQAIDEPLPITGAATVTVKGANVLDAWDTPAFSKVWDYDERGIMVFLDDEAGTDTGYRYWRLEIIDRTNPAGPEGISFSHFYLGTYFTPTSRNVSTGYSKEIIDPTLEQTSEDGTQYFSKRSQYLSITGTSINYLDLSDKKGLERLFEKHGKFKPLFVSLDPTLCISDNVSDLTRFMIFLDVPRFEHFRNNVYSFLFSMREAI